MGNKQNESKLCPACSRAVKDYYNYCPKCGRQLKGTVKILTPQEIQAARTLSENPGGLIEE